jgi:catechol 2,3-dioxygenase-like lactoylglutathione lyase family enzyme
MAHYTKAFSSFSTNDLQAARKFYAGVLQIDTKELSHFLELHIGETEIVIYAKDNHEPATFTVLNFYVQDLEQEVAALKQKGIAFEQYDLPGLRTNKDGILADEEMKMKTAWFKDPAGNILSLIQKTET